MRYLHYSLFFLVFLVSGILSNTSQDASDIVPLAKGKDKELLVQEVKKGELLLIRPKGSTIKI